MKKEKSCGAIVYKIEDDNVYYLLIQQRSFNWGFPKGHVEDGEEEIDTAKREVFEETGATIDIKDSFKEETSYLISKKIKKKVIYFLAQLKDGPIVKQESEILDIKWLPYNNALALLSFESDKELLRKANVILQNKGLK